MNRRFVLLAAIVLVVGTAGAYLLHRSDVAGGDDPQDKIARVEQLSQDGSSASLNKVAAIAMNDAEDMSVRRAAVMSLPRFSSPAASSVVLKAAAHPAPEIRQSAAYAMGQCKDVPASLLQALADKDPDATVQKAAMFSLSKCDDPRAVVALLETAEKDPDDARKLVAMKALLDRLSASLGVGCEPSNKALWADLVQRVKRTSHVKKAYADTGTTLVMREQDVLKPPASNGPSCGQGRPEGSQP